MVFFWLRLRGSARLILVIREGEMVVLLRFA